MKIHNCRCIDNQAPSSIKQVYMPEQHTIKSRPHEDIKYPWKKLKTSSRTFVLVQAPKGKWVEKKGHADDEAKRRSAGDENLEREISTSTVSGNSSSCSATDDKKGHIDARSSKPLPSILRRRKIPGTKTYGPVAFGTANPQSKTDVGGDVHVEERALSTVTSNGSDISNALPTAMRQLKSSRRGAHVTPRDAADLFLIAARHVEAKSILRKSNANAIADPIAQPAAAQTSGDGQPTELHESSHNKLVSQSCDLLSIAIMESKYRHRNMTEYRKLLSISQQFNKEIMHLYRRNFELRVANT